MLPVAVKIIILIIIIIIRHVTVSCPLAESYVTEAAREAGAAAELAATRKEAKYAGIVGRHICLNQ